MRAKTQVDRSQYLFSNRMLVQLIIPLIIEQLLAVLVGLADSIMIANVGEAAVSGVNLVDNIMVLLINIFSALATGGAVVAGQYLGQKREEEACKSADQLVWFIAGCAIGITLLVYLAQNFILYTVFGQIAEDVREYARIYLWIVAASIPFIALYNGGAAISRAMGDSGTPMKIAVIMNVINVCGNAILIFGFHRGAEGVAIPTLVSRMAAAALIIAVLLDPKKTLHLTKSLHFQPNGNMIKKILHIGVPNGLENSMFQLGKIIVLSLVATFGTSAIAANAVSNAVALFHILPGMALNLAVTTVISRCVGAGDYVQVRYYTRKFLILTHISLAFTCAVIYAALPFILRAYNLSTETAAMAEKILIFHGFCMIVIWPESFILPGTFRASGDVRFSMFTAILSMWVFRILFSYIFGKYMGTGVFGVWAAMVLDWCVRATLFLIRYFSGRWRHEAIV